MTGLLRICPLSLSHLCLLQLQEATNRFAKPVEASFLNEAAKGVVPLKTEQSTQWAVKNFMCWRRSRFATHATATHAT